MSNMKIRGKDENSLKIFCSSECERYPDRNGLLTEFRKKTTLIQKERNQARYGGI
jgi:hypothetical protein